MVAILEEMIKCIESIEVLKKKRIDINNNVYYSMFDRKKELEHDLDINLRSQNRIAKRYAQLKKQLN